MYQCFEHSRLKKDHIDTIVGYTRKSCNFHTVILGGYERLEKALETANRSFTKFKLGEEIENPVGFERPWNLMLLDPSPKLFSDPRLIEVIKTMPERSCVILVARTTTPTILGNEFIDLDVMTEDELDELGVAYDDPRVIRPHHCPYKQESLEIQQFLRDTLIKTEDDRLICRYTRADDQWPMDYEIFLLEKTNVHHRPLKSTSTKAKGRPTTGSDGFFSLFIENTTNFPNVGCVLAVDGDREEKLSYCGLDLKTGELQSVQRMFHDSPMVDIREGTEIKTYIPPKTPNTLKFLSCYHPADLAKMAVKG